MPITLNDVKPISLCITTEELLDSKRFLYNFCDTLILRGKDNRLKEDLKSVKKEMNDFRTQLRFLNGYRTVIINNIDKILALINSRYYKTDPVKIDRIAMDGKDIIKKILNVENFEGLIALEPEFKGKITLPIYQFFINEMKKSNIEVI
jgi:hypothetical protein